MPVTKTSVKRLDAIINGAKNGVIDLVKSNGRADKKEFADYPEMNHQIDTIDQLQASISTIESDINPALFQVLKSQIQVLDTISSPTMTGMMIDNLVQGLKQSLEKANLDSVAIIQESYTRLIQNYVFMAEAKMHYIVDKNKEEANRLLVESGKMIADTFSDIAAIAVPAGKANTIVKSVNKKMFEIAPSSGGDFVSNVVNFLNAKNVIEEKQKEFFNTIDNLFDTFEKYPNLFGKSIVINGMLSKYRKKLVERFADAKVKVIKNRKSVAELQKANQLSNELANTLKKGDFLGMVSTGVKAALDTVLARKATQYDLQSFFMMYDTFEAEVKELKSSFEFEESRLKQLEAEQKQLGFFSFSKKKESAQSIDVQLDKLKDKKKELADAEMKLKELKSLFPEARSIKEDIIRYDSRLKAIESLYLA